MSTDRFLYEEECRQIIGACYEVQNNLGYGFLEAVYQEALSREFVQKSIVFHSQKKLNIYYKEELLDKFYVADFLCFSKIVLEIKACDTLTDNHLFKC